MIDFLDQKEEVNAFCVGIGEGLRHPTAFYPESIPTDVPEDLVTDTKKAFGQYNAGFFLAKAILIIAVAACAKLGISNVIPGL